MAQPAIPLYAAATAYTDAGLCIIPIKTDGTKAPTVPAWKQYQDAPPTQGDVRQWWGNGHAPGIGIVWGKVSGNGEALDFDAPGQHEDFAALCEQQGLADVLNSCPLVETPSGGRHLLYRCETPVQGNRKLAQRLDTETGAVETLIETRGEGGYTIAPGSPAACHPDKKPYKFLRGRPSTLPTITAEQRGLLLALAASFNEYVKPADVRQEPKPHKQERGSAGLSPGDDYNARGDYEGLLARHGWPQRGGHGGKTFWQRPGKSGPGISATTGHAGTRLLYVFSSNAAPFDHETAYSPFAVYALLEHGGDYSEAARELGRQGYGDPLPPRTHSGSQEGVNAHAAASSPASVPVGEWPQPAPEAFHGLAGDVVRVIEPHTEADPVALLVQFLVAFGSVIGRGPHFKAEGDKHSGNLFAVLVGVSSKGRKGTSLRRVLPFFESVAQDWTDKRVLSGLSSGEGLIHAVRDPLEREEKNKKTSEMETVLVDAGIADKRLLVTEGEFASVLRQTQRDGNTLSATIRNAWDTGVLRTMTKSSPAQATGAHVSIVGHITAGELRKDLAETETANGFGNRFLWVCVQRSKLLPFGGDMDSVDTAPLLSRMRSALEHAQGTGQVQFDDGARALWADVYPDLSAGKPGLLGAMTGRSEAQVVRLALLYALLDCDTAIRIDHLTAALALWEYCEASARFIFGDSLGDKVADDILRALREKREGLTRTELRDLFQKNQSAGRIGQVLEMLAAQGLARMERQAAEGGRRPSEVWIAAK